MKEKLSIQQKALKINLDIKRYGSFAEIGAGQEVVRQFFQASGSAGTVAKSLSAYDMTVSDAIYKKTKYYVSESRLEQMLEHEKNSILKLLDNQEGDKRDFFSYANTVSARNYQGTNRCHGWMGVDFQDSSTKQFNRVKVHFNLYDKTNLLQQEAVGILGVNLLYACFYQQDSKQFLQILFQDLHKKRIEVDYIDFSGNCFEGIDNRLMSLYLVQMGLSQAAMFDWDKKALLPSKQFYKKNIMILRGSFYPLTNLHFDIIQSSIDKYREIVGRDKDVIPAMEITMNSIFSSNDEKKNLSLFLKKADMLCEAGCKVLITGFSEYYRLSRFLQNNLASDISFCCGVNVIEKIFAEEFYQHLTGGLLEALGKMFKKGVRLFVYPYKQPHSDEIIFLNQVKVSAKVQDILEYFKKQNYIIAVEKFRKEYLGKNPEYIVGKVKVKDKSWQDYLPQVVANKVNEQDLLSKVKKKK